MSVILTVKHLQLRNSTCAVWLAPSRSQWAGAAEQNTTVLLTTRHTEQGRPRA